MQVSVLFADFAFSAKIPCPVVTSEMATSIRYSASKLSLLDRLMKRCLVSLTYPDNKDVLNNIRNELKQPSTVYAGFDATSDSLHIGNLAILMNLLHFHRDGHQVICLIGDSTVKIGDPSGHTMDRKQIETSTINQNASSIETTIRNVFSNFSSHFSHRIDCQGIKPPIIVRNSSWYTNINVIDFVNDIFRVIRVGDLLHKKSIQDRLASREGMNMSEFSYQIFQAFDWHTLRTRYDCKFQVGGSDQAGNIYTGYELLKKYTGKRDTYGLLVPLIVDQSGKKLGKSAQATQSSQVCLNAARTSPTKLYKTVMISPHSVIERLLKVYTFLEMDEIEDMIQNKLKTKNDVTYCHRKLAEDMCLLVHGQKPWIQ